MKIRVRNADGTPFRDYVYSILVVFYVYRMYSVKVLLIQYMPIENLNTYTTQESFHLNSNGLYVMNKFLQTPIPETLTNAYFEKNNENEASVQGSIQNVIYSMGYQFLYFVGFFFPVG